MKIAIMQPYFLPYIGYFQNINLVDKYVLYDDVNYFKRGWINRNRILIGNKEHMFILTLKGASSFKLINEIELLDNKSSILKTIQQAYAKAPYFKETLQVLANIFSFHSNNLALFVNNSVKEICIYLEINTEIIISSAIEKDNQLKAQDKIIAICKTLGADHYVNASGGQELYNKEDFNSNDIQLSFIKTNSIKYPQFNNEFIPGLSMIDVMMFNSPKEIKKLLSEYELL